MAGLLENKSIVIIGGTSGIGLSAAKAFAREGALLTIMGRNQATLNSALTELGNKTEAVCGDASDSKMVDMTVGRAVAKFGKLDGLYHVAGGSGRKHGDGPLHEITDEGIDYTLNLNLSSILYSNRAATQQFLKQQSGGVVLNLASVLGFSPSPHHFGTAVYAAAKAAIIGTTRSSAAYYARFNIRFNVIAPGLVDTPMAQRAMQNEEILQFIKTKQPLEGGRAGEPEDLDDAAIFFMSDQSKYVTGQLLAVDGGWSVAEGQIHEK
ncbi:MAG: SDR family NAD(P)-dependent oxidoreductase [Verrucomicrobiales bacterium]